MATKLPPSDWTNLSVKQLQALIVEESITLSAGNYALPFPKELHYRSNDITSMQGHYEQITAVFNLALKPLKLEVEKLHSKEIIHVRYDWETSELLVKCTHTFSITICPLRRVLNITDFCKVLKTGIITLHKNQRLQITQMSDKQVEAFERLSTKGEDFLRLVESFFSRKVHLQASSGNLELLCSSRTHSITLVASSDISIKRE